MDEKVKEILEKVYELNMINQKTSILLYEVNLLIKEIKEEEKKLGRPYI